MLEQLSLFDENVGEAILTQAQRETLQKLYEQGYHYVTENPDCPPLPLLFFSSKPSRTRIKEANGLTYSVWGYSDKDCRLGHTLMSAPVLDFDIEMLHGRTKTKPLLLKELLQGE